MLWPQQASELRESLGVATDLRPWTTRPGIALYGVRGEREREGLNLAWIRFCQSKSIPFDSYGHAADLFVNPTQSFHRMQVTTGKIGTQLTGTRTYSFGLDRTVMSFDILAMMGHDPSMLDFLQDETRAKELVGECISVQCMGAVLYAGVCTCYFPGLFAADACI
jgi:hypothetical protein